MDSIDRIAEALRTLRRAQAAARHRRHAAEGAPNHLRLHLGQEHPPFRGGMHPGQRPRQDADGQWHGGPGPQGGELARMRLLEVLEGSDGLAVTEIAARIGVDQPRASRLVRDAEGRGTIRRLADPSDGRRSVLQLTDAGRAAIEQQRTQRRAAVEAAAAALTPAEQATLADLLTKFAANWPGGQPAANES